MKFLYITVGLLFAALSTTAHAKNPTGVWLANNGKAKVKISQCGSSLCAKIIALTQPNDAQGRPMRDQNNPNPRLKNRKIVGISLFLGMAPSGNDFWSGRLYSPEKGGTYSGNVKQISRNLLQVKGCLGMFCQSYMWKRIQ